MFPGGTEDGHVAAFLCLETVFQNLDHLAVACGVLEVM